MKKQHTQLSVSEAMELPKSMRTKAGIGANISSTIIDILNREKNGLSIDRIIHSFYKLTGREIKRQAFIQRLLMLKKEGRIKRHEKYRGVYLPVDGDEIDDIDEDELNNIVNKGVKK
jgi:hypothetical protein